MDENNENITQENPSAADPETPVAAPELVSASETSAETASIRKRRVPWIWLGVLFFILMLALGVFLGYRQGIARRLAREQTTVVEVAAEQYQMAYQDIAAGNYQNAKARIEYVIKIYPQFPGAPELLRSILMNIEQPTPTATLAIIATLTPSPSGTPDTRSAEEAFNAITAAAAAKNWQAVVDNVIAIQQINYEYRTVDVAGYYYIGLRNLGIQKIQAGELEQGLFDLSSAEQLGPLDGEAEGVRSWATLYLSGASFWDVNWQRAIEIFQQIKEAYPYMMDASGMTAIERYRVALFKYGDQIAGTGDYCTAYQYYLRSLAVAQDPNVQATADLYKQNCQSSQPTEVTPTEPTPPDATFTPPTELTPSPPPTDSPTP
ncbi:MAG: hypothetical protein AAGU04_01675 [Anaerolineaceae bacterium]